MKRKTVQTMVLSALFIALGMVLPFFTGQIPAIGKMLLPMHIPVFLCGLLCGWKYGFVVGFILPLLRSLIFSQPVLYPTAVSMAFELATYGAVIGWLYEKAKYHCIRSLYRCLILSMLAGRAVLCIAEMILLGVFGNGFAFSAFFLSAFWNALPGILLQLLLIPSVLLLMKRTHLLPAKGQSENPQPLTASACEGNPNDQI